jgi:FkbM family methyltransferase
VTASGFVSENGQVHALEPTPQNFVRLRKNLEPFHWAIAQPHAVGNVTGELLIHYSDKEAEWASVHEQHRQGNLPCNSAIGPIRSDDRLPYNPVDRIDFINPDIEGSELDGRRGAQQTLFHFHPTIVAQTKCGWTDDEIRNLLSAAGYGCRSFCWGRHFGHSEPLTGSHGARYHRNYGVGAKCRIVLHTTSAIVVSIF